MQTHVVVAHVAFNLLFGGKGSYGVDYKDVDGRRTDKLIGYFESLFAVVGLRNPKVGHVYAKLFGIETVEGVLGIDKGGNATSLLCFGNGVNGECGFTRRFGAVYLDDASAWITTNAQGNV